MWRVLWLLRLRRVLLVRRHVRSWERYPTCEGSSSAGHSSIGGGIHGGIPGGTWDYGDNYLLNQITNWDIPPLPINPSSEYPVSNNCVLARSGWIVTSKLDCQHVWHDVNMPSIVDYLMDIIICQVSASHRKPPLPSRNMRVL